MEQSGDEEQGALVQYTGDSPKPDEIVEMNTLDPSYEGLKMEIIELSHIMIGLRQMCKLADDKRRVMERRNTFLLKDNKSLMEQWSEAQKNRILAEAEAFELEREVKLLRQIIQDKDNETNSAPRKEVEMRNQSTSCSEAELDKNTKKKEFDLKKKELQKEFNAGSVVLTKQELDQLENDMKELRESLERRESTWSKTAERERLQRVRLSKLLIENQNLKNLNNWKTSELEFKTRKLKAKIQEVMMLKKELTKLKLTSTTRFSSQSKPISSLSLPAKPGKKSTSSKKEEKAPKAKSKKKKTVHSPELIEEYESTIKASDKLWKTSLIQVPTENISNQFIDNTVSSTSLSSSCPYDR